MLLSLSLLALTYLGGIASLTGALVAGALATGGVVTVATGGAESSQGQFALTGLALVAATVLAPDGLRGRATASWAWAKRRDIGTIARSGGAPAGPGVATPPLAAATTTTTAGTASRTAGTTTTTAGTAAATSAAGTSPAAPSSAATPAEGRAGS